MWEKMNGHLRLSIHHPIDKTLAALKISKSTLYKYYTDGQIETAIVKKKQVKYDDFDMGVIRRKVLSFFARGEIATLTKVNKIFAFHRLCLSVCLSRSFAHF